MAKSGKVTPAPAPVEVEGPVISKEPKPPTHCIQDHIVKEVRKAHALCTGDMYCSGMQA